MTLKKRKRSHRPPGLSSPWRTELVWFCIVVVSAIFVALFVTRYQN